MKNNSKYAGRGTLVYDFDSTMNADMWVLFCKELVEKIVSLISAHPQSGIKKVVVQADSAGGHGGRGKGIEKRLIELNDFSRTHIQEFDEAPSLPPILTSQGTRVID